MSDKLEALRLEAETLSGLMMQLAENEIDSDSFAVMSDLGENGQEHECDLPITETALRAAAVIGLLLAALEEKDQKIEAMKEEAEGSNQRTQMVFEAKNHWAERARAAEQRLQQPIPAIGSVEVNDAAWKLHDTLTEYGPLNGHQFNNLKGCFYEALKTCFKVSGE